MDEIADELSDWAAGGSNPALDRWLESSDMEGDFGDRLYRATHPTLRKQLDQFDRQLKKVENQNVQRILSRAKERASFRQTNSTKSRFSVKDNTIYLAENSGIDSIAHELFHEIDVAYGITSSGALKESLDKDYKNMLKNARVSGKSIPAMLQSLCPGMFQGNDVKQVFPEYRGVSDILNGLSGGNIWLGFGHRDEYWHKEGRLEAETWAQFGRILFMQDKEVVKFMQQNFPNVYQEITDIIERMIK